MPSSCHETIEKNEKTVLVAYVITSLKILKKIIYLNIILNTEFEAFKVLLSKILINTVYSQGIVNL